MKLVKATCPACGGSLEVADNLASANCPHCGSKIILDWEGQTSLAVHLDLGKTFLQAGNYQEADKHFSLALEKNPRSGDAWFWKGVARIASIRSAETDKRSILEEGNAYLQRSGFPRDEMLSNLVVLLQGKQLCDMLLTIQPFIDKNIPRGKAISDLFFSAAKASLPRVQFLSMFEQQIAKIQSLLAEVSGGERRRLYEKFRLESQLARVFLDVILPDQPGDVVHGKKDWWEKQQIAAKPSYWLEYLNRQEKYYEQKL